MQQEGHRDEPTGYRPTLRQPPARRKAPKGEQITTGQLRELLEADERIGLRKPLQRFIITQKGEAVDYGQDAWEVERQRQALVLWRLGIGSELGYKDFSAYLASIPAIAEKMRWENNLYPHLALVDCRVGLVKCCSLAGVSGWHIDDQYTHPYWIVCNDGRRRRSVSVRDAKCEFQKQECGLTVTDGVGLFIHVPQILIRGYAMILEELPLFADCGDVPVLSLGCSGPTITWVNASLPKPYQGVASKLTPGALS